MSEADIKTERQKPKRNRLKTVLTVLVLLGILVVSFHWFWPEFPFYQRPFTECDPNKILDLIKENFDITFPNKIISAKAAEKEIVFPDHCYLFALKFTTDLKEWEQFRTSFPKKNNKDTISYDVDGNRFVHDVYGFMDCRLSNGSQTVYSEEYPNWFRKEIRKGKHYCWYLANSKEPYLQIDGIYVDMANTQEIVFYIKGWGDYDDSYGLD
ncbi:MAG: hypothetical protein ACYSSI_05440 [Planctomycetota bacterium]|jgi:hypothetical protein